MGLIDKILELCAYDDEQEWFEFKENWFQADEENRIVERGYSGRKFNYELNVVERCFLYNRDEAVKCMVNI